MYKWTKFNYTRHFPHWLWIPILVGSVAAWSLPFISEHHDDTWDNFRGERAQLPLTSLDRLYQFNVDQPDWIKIAQAFPGYYSVSNYRINRPGYPAMLLLACKIQQGTYKAITHLNLQGFSTTCSEPLIIFSGLVLNWLLFIGSVIGFYYLLIFWRASDIVASLATAQFALSPFVSWTMLTIATDFVVFPIIIIVLWLSSVIIRQDQVPLTKQPSRYAFEFTAGLLIGILMLVKSQYDIVITTWIILISLRHFRAVMLSFVGHLIPLFLWMSIVRLAGWNYYNPEIEVYRQGVWIWESFLNWTFQEQWAYIQTHLIDYSSYFIRAFGWITIALTGLGIVSCIRQRRISLLLVSILALLINCGFVFAIRRYYSVYVSETFFFVYPLAALGFEYLLTYVPSKHRTRVTTVYVLTATAIAWPLFWLDAFNLQLYP